MEISDPEPKYGLSRSGPVVRGVDLHLCLGRSTTVPLLKERLMPIQEQPFKNPTLEALGDHLKLSLALRFITRWRQEEAKLISLKKINICYQVCLQSSVVMVDVSVSIHVL